MNQLQLQEFKNRFNAIIERFEGRHSAELLQSNQGDEMDRAQGDRDNLLKLKLQGRVEFYLKKVHQAVVRIEEGTFGICCECEGEIELGRLHARPVATRCITCKEEQERVEDHIPYQRKSHTLGKTFDKSNVRQLPGHIPADRLRSLSDLRAGEGVGRR